MKNLILLSLSLLFLNFIGISQKCSYFLEDSVDSNVDYMQVDISLLNSVNEVLFIQNQNGKVTYFRFKEEGEQMILEKIISNRIVFTKTVEGNLSGFKVESNAKLFLYGLNTRHTFDMCLIKKGENFFQIIPIGSRIEESYSCLEAFDPSLFKSISSLQEIIR